MRSRRTAGALLILLLGPSLAVGTEPELPQLQRVFAGHFRIGAALGTDRVLQQPNRVLELVSRQCNSITPENQLKWESVHPRPGEYEFFPVDKFVEYREANGMFMVRHTLVWHSQVPGWVFQDEAGKPLAREALLERMRDPIHTVVGRYQGRIQGWDVVNEAFEDDGSLRDTPWRRAIGDDYLVKAFQFAHQADPKAELYYNDYAMVLPGKRTATARLVKQLKAAGCRIDGVGLQSHWRLDSPALVEVERALEDYSQLVVQLMLTELDVNVLPWPKEHQQAADVRLRGNLAAGLDPYVDGLPDEMQRTLADRYADLFRLFVKYSDQISRVTCWGVDDGHSWHNGWPIAGRTAHSLLFDRAYQPKPAFWSVVGTATAN